MIETTKRAPRYRFVEVVSSLNQRGRQRWHGVVEDISTRVRRVVATRQGSALAAERAVRDWCRGAKAPLLKDLRIEYFDSQAARGYSPNTLEGEDHILKPMIAHFGAETEAATVTQDDFLPWFASAYRERSPGAKRKARYTLCRFWAFGVERAACYENPALSIPKEKTLRIPVFSKQALADADIEAVLKRLELRAKESQTPWLPVAWEVLCFSGFRLGTLAQLRWEHVEFEREEWHLPAPILKQRQPLIAAMHPRCLERLKRWYVAMWEGLGIDAVRSDARVFRGFLPNRLRSELQEIGRRLGIKVLPKMARDYYQSYLRRRGVSFELYMQLLGHQSVDVALRHYGSVSHEDQREKLREIVERDLQKVNSSSGSV